MVFIINFFVTIMYLSKFNEELFFFGRVLRSRTVELLKCEILDLIQMRD